MPTLDEVVECIAEAFDVPAIVAAEWLAGGAINLTERD